ncbi:RagB/SusD family nutrient uptake outer membrane protein [Chitinophaga sancti]|uniref:RagB/SusD family nutrient uptake outer membrane protein n=1 Tax=Chitinophaga sancti TaxID=1004 RepID=A0A1K1SKU1_9BACT|nr:RagB/SusD family nutrient uptake outer membrane protein [Chitinophaga sancti]WQD64486.1 RagB/SusD family nutrient uptake outer membrane protein [Chitinophaga sancti]WQG89890.1 RagB/SusD family nutrient uptake outer membrane protein [Chitinophaga sancti]SFW84469.1 SusD family protein [Chitinophaga sancti]
MRLIITTLILALTFTSCKKWLDIQPESEISDEVLYSTQEGFQEALIGVYTKCSQEGLYGRELTVGTPEVLAQNYTLSDNDKYYYLKTSKYIYTDADFISRKDNIWQGLYNAIANCNLLLSNVDKKRKLFTGNNYALIKGEALALRAYLHFDLLRLFAPVTTTATGIPYVTKYSKDITPMSTVGAVLDSAIADLSKAKELLSIDPIIRKSYIVGYPTEKDSTLNTEESDPSLFLQNRRHRLNYYAVCGTLARVYLYKNDKANALSNALEVINSNKFPWTNNSDFLAVDDDKKDRILYKELLFGWYVPAMANKYKNEFFLTSTSGIHLSENAGQSIYETGGAGADDLRYKEWFVSSSGSTSNTLNITKYLHNTDNTAADANLHYMMAPAIRLSEMYYIAAECSNNAAYLNTVRTHRGIGSPASGDLITALLKEGRKEWYGEGQIFYMYKRLNHDIANQNGGSIPASDKIFVLPLPNDEILYGGR